MEKKITTLKPFFDEPTKSFHIRELSRMLNINHTSIRLHLNNCVEEGYLEKTKGDTYPAYKLVISRKTLNLKLYHNLEKLRCSGIIEALEKHYDYPTIVLFGSYASATDVSGSDIDICIISEADKEINVSGFEKTLNRKISIHRFTKKLWQNEKKTNPGLVNSICNGIVLSGELEVI